MILYPLFQSYYVKHNVENVLLVEFMYPVFIHMPGGVIVGDSGLCCCVPVQCVTSIVRAHACALFSRPDMTFAVDWALQTNYQSIPLFVDSTSNTVSFVFT